jgi:hypothetical protein
VNLITGDSLFGHLLKHVPFTSFIHVLRKHRQLKRKEAIHAAG